MRLCGDSTKNSSEINMDYKIPFVFLLGFYRGLQKKNGILLGVQKISQKKKAWGFHMVSREIRKKHNELFEGLHNILRGTLFNSKGFCFFDNICG